MALLGSSSWRARAFYMAEGLLSQSLMEPSMFVNRKVTVPVGGTLICSAASFRHR